MVKQNLNEWKNKVLEMSYKNFSKMIHNRTA